MTSTSNPSDYYNTLRYFTTDGSAIRVDPPFGPFLKLGQHDRLINSKLLDPRLADVEAPHTIEGLFNRLMGEVETTGMAATLLFHVQADFDNRLKKVTAETLHNYREMHETMEALEEMVGRSSQESSSFEKRLRKLKSQLAHIYKHGMTTGVPPQTEGTGKPLYEREHRPAEPPLSQTEKQFRLRTCGTSYGDDRSGERAFNWHNKNMRIDILAKKFEDGHSQNKSSQMESSRDKKSGTKLEDIDKHIAARTVQRHGVARQHVWARIFTKEKLREDLEFLESQEPKLSRVWDSQRKKVVNGMCATAIPIPRLKPHLEQCEAMAHSLESKLHPEGHGKPIPLLEISFNKPVDEMSEAEMRELLKSLPVTICVDPTVLQRHCRFDDTESKEEDGSERDDVEDEEDGGEDGDEVIEDEDEVAQVCQDKGKETPASFVPPPPLGGHSTATGGIRFGETSFNGGRGPSWPAPTYPSVHPPFSAGRASGARNATPNHPASVGGPSSSATPQQARTVPENPIAPQPPLTTSKKRARSPDELGTGDNSDAREPRAHLYADPDVNPNLKKRKVC